MLGAISLVPGEDMATSAVGGLEIGRRRILGGMGPGASSKTGGVNTTGDIEEEGVTVAEVDWLAEEDPGKGKVVWLVEKDGAGGKVAEGTKVDW
jgi:hypothetical protein